MTTGPPEAGWLLDAGSHEVIAPLPGAHQMSDEPRRVVELLAQILSRLGIPAVTTALWGCLVARNAYAYS